jgi:hypothetical protein
MGISDFVNNNQGRSLQGTLDNTLPRISDLEDPRGEGLQPVDVDAPGEFDPPPGPGGAPRPFSPIIPQGPAAAFRIGKEVAEGKFSQGVASALWEVAGAPIRSMLDLLSNLDRPQQSTFAAILSAMEGESPGDAVNAAIGGFVYRDPETGMHNRRIEPVEVMDSFARNVLAIPDGIDRMPGDAKFALSLGLLFGLDPLVLTPGAFYRKTGSRIKQFYHGAKIADKQRRVLTHGTDIRAAAQAVSNDIVHEELSRAGKSDGVLGEVYGNLSEDVGDVEMDKFRGYLSDYLSGLGAQNIVSQELRALLTRGDLNPDQVKGLMNRVMETPLEGSEVENLTQAASRFLGRLRGQGDLETRWIRSVRVGERGGADTGKIVTLHDGPDEFLIGQLMNRFGLMPTEAIKPSVLKAARKLIGETEKKFVGRLTENLEKDPSGIMEIWNGLTKREKVAALAADRHLAKSGKVSRSKFKVERGKFADRAFEPGSRGGLELLKHLSAPERAKLVKKAVSKGLVGPEAQATAGRVFPGGAQFVRRLFKEAGEALPTNASEQVKKATARMAETGPFVIDAVTGDVLRRRLMKMDITAQGAHDLAMFAAGLQKWETVSDIPRTLANPGVMRSMLDSGNFDTKNFHMLTWMLDPATAMPRPIFAALKLSEDAMIGESNYLTKLLEAKMQIGGKPIREGSDIDRLIGKALNGDEGAIAAVRSWDEAGDAWKVYGAQRGFYDGMLARLAKLDIDDFQAVHAAQAKNNPIMSTYFPRLYPNEVEGLEHARTLGIEVSDDVIKRAKDRGGDWHLMVGPQELDFIDGTQVAFRHGKSRQFENAIPGQDFSSLKALRAYAHGAARKIHLEPAIKKVNQTVKDLDAAGSSARLNITQKRYMQALFRRMRGIEQPMENSLNEFLSAVASKFGINLKPRPATRASLFITGQYYMGLLGANLGFYLKNLSQGINTATAVGPLNYMKGAALMMDKEYRALRSSRNLLAQFDQLFESTKFKGGGINLQKIIMAPARHSELVNRGIAFNAGMTSRLRELGHARRPIAEVIANHTDDFEDAINFAHATANETQFIYGILGRSPIAGSPIGRMALQFFSWPVKQVEFLANNTFKNPDGPWSGARFFMNYVLLSGVFSKVAEHANVDAGSFAGFGFFPGMASPTTQAFAQMSMGIAAGANGDSEQSAIHIKKMTKQVQNMIPAWLQLQKTVSFLESTQTGERRGFRERLSRRTDEPDLGQEALDERVNPFFRRLGLNELTTESTTQFFGLPSLKGAEHRDMMKDYRIGKVKADRMAARFLDEYLLERYGNGDFVRAYQVQREAMEAGVPITQDMIDREFVRRRAGDEQNVIGDVRSSMRRQLEEEIDAKYPKRVTRGLRELQPIPVNPLGGAASKDGTLP